MTSDSDLGILWSIYWATRGGVRTHVLKILSSLHGRLLICYHLQEERSNLSDSPRLRMSNQAKFKYRPIFRAAIVSAALISGCSASGSPLSINLYNPNTGVQHTCAAKESSSKDVSVLSSAVETCAKQLEARGFVRGDSP
jgi:hypothetical protein